MPKRVAKEAKRVPLNCLVLPETREWLRAAEGSQGEAVDRAVAALRMQEAQGRVIAESLASDIEEFDQRRQEMLERRARGARAFKGPIPRPKDKKQ